MHYQGYYYCPYCQVWLPAKSPEVLDRDGRVIHAVCGRKLRTRPRKPYAKRSYSRIDPEKRLAVTAVTLSGGRA